MEHTKHLWRAGLIILAVTIVGVSLRQVMIPKSFGAEGYRTDSLGEYMAYPVIHGGKTSCNECHAEVAKTKDASAHAPVSCEVCHAPLASHVVGEKKPANMAVDRSHLLCGYCHQKLVARPPSMPQVDILEHLISQEVIGAGDKIPEGVCIMCHDPHEL